MEPERFQHVVDRQDDEISPPPDVEPLPPDLRGAATIRERLERHRSDEACASCHRAIDPLGFAFENFNPIGQWRDRYRGSKRPIDASGTLPDGRVLITGGCIGDECERGLIAAAEIWDPETSSFSPAGPLSEPGGGSATLLSDGRVLIVGRETAEVWTPSDE